MTPLWIGVIAELLVVVTGVSIALVIDGRIGSGFAREFALGIAITFDLSGIVHSSCNPQSFGSTVPPPYQLSRRLGDSANQHTLMHHLCPVCEGERKRVLDREEMSKATFRRAADGWLENKRPYISARTSLDYKNYVKILSSFFGDMILKDIHIGNIRAYQDQRKADGCGAVAINHEVGSLRQMLDEAGLWAPIKPHFRQIPMDEEGPGQALSQEELTKLFKTARKDTRWEVALHCSILSSQTAIGPGELKKLRLGDIQLSNDPPLIHICKGAKNRYRIRTIPLGNRASLTSARFLVERALEKGASEPEHYLLPARSKVKGKKPYDPTRPQTHWNRAWDRMRKAAGFPHLRQYDMRHTAITRLLEKPFISDRNVIEIAGHVSDKMLNRYSHQRIEAKRVALSALDDLELG